MTFAIVIMVSPLRGGPGSTDFPPITDEDLTKLEVELQLIPFIVSTTQRAEQSSSGEPQLTQTEAENLVEILHRVRSHPQISVLRAQLLPIRSCHLTR